MLIQPPQCLAPSLQIIRSIDMIYEGGLPAPVESVVVPSEFAAPPMSTSGEVSSHTTRVSLESARKKR